MPNQNDLQHTTSPRRRGRRPCTICGRPSNARGLCHTHYNRLLSHGDPRHGGAIRHKHLTLEQTIAYETGRAIRRGDCLIAAAVSRDGEGYCRVAYQGKLIGLHRASLQLHIGRELKRDEMACHTCNNRDCFNPAHLYAGSAADNARDRDHDGNPTRGHLNARAKLTEDDVREIRRAIASRDQTFASVRDLAAKFGVHRNTIHRAVNGARWGHLAQEESLV